ncbi:putative ABC-transporter domain-containing protein [Dioscorea sansibarensis]
MAGILAADELGMSSGSRRSWMTSSFRDPSDVFKKNASEEEDDEDALRWAAIEKLPTSNRMTRGVLRHVDENGKISSNELDVRRLGVQEKKVLMERILKVVEEDNERFLRRLRARIDQVGLELPKIEVRFENLAVEADAYPRGRALPTLLNATINTLEGIAGFVKFSPTKKRINKILRGVTGIIRPSR